MKYLAIFALSLAAFGQTTLPSAKECLTVAAAGYGGWRPIASAPRDGTVVEALITYGFAPWYGLFKWEKNIAFGNTRTWIRVDKPHSGVSENNCLFWRPYKSTGKPYVDPTNGTQDTVAYQCTYMHLSYDAFKDRCIRP
jgi:hypothetical protein